MFRDAIKVGCQVTSCSQSNLIIEVVRVKKLKAEDIVRYAVQIIPHAQRLLSQSNSLCHFSIWSLSESCWILDPTEPTVCAFTHTWTWPAELCGLGSNLVFFNI